MTAQDLNVVLGSAFSVLAIIGGGIKYLLARVDEKNRHAAAEQLQARQELTARLHVEISDLRAVVSRLQSENAVYMRRVYALEGYLQTIPGVQLPETPGWPPH